MFKINSCLNSWVMKDKIYDLIMVVLSHPEYI
jgi:hypothetical protein